MAPLGSLCIIFRFAIEHEDLMAIVLASESAADKDLGGVH